jgi:hypothetical protein
MNSRSPHQLGPRHQQVLPDRFQQDGTGSSSPKQPVCCTAAARSSTPPSDSIARLTVGQVRDDGGLCRTYSAIMSATPRVNGFTWWQRMAWAVADGVAGLVYDDSVGDGVLRLPGAGVRGGTGLLGWSHRVRAVAAAGRFRDAGAWQG